MNSKEYLESLGGIDNELIESAAAMKKAPRRRYGIFAGAAAAAAVIAAGILFASGAFGGRPKGDMSAVLPDETGRPSASAPASAQPNTDPTPVPTAAPDPFLPDDIAWIGDDELGIRLEDMDVGNYFIYDGRVYQPCMQYVSYVQPEVFGLIGQKVANVAFIYGGGDEADGSGFVTDNISGSFTAPVYELRGCDPRKLLGLIHDGELSVCFSGSGVVTGGDLFEGAFSLRDSLSALLYEGYDRESGGYSEVPTRRLDPAAYPAIGRFIDALYGAELVENPHKNVYADAVFYLHLMLDNGLRVELTLMSDGSVFFPDTFSEAMLRLDGAAADELIALLRAGEGDEAVLPERDLEGQARYLRSLGGVGAYLPAAVPNGFFIEYFDAEPVFGGEVTPTGYSHAWMHLKCIEEYALIEYSVYERSAYEASPRYAQHDDLTVGAVMPVPIEEFTRESILDCILNKEGEEHSLYAAVAVGDYVIYVYSTYIIDDETGSPIGLDSLVDTVYELIVSAANQA